MPVEPDSSPEALIASTVHGAATRGRGAGRTTRNTTRAPSTTTPAACRAKSGFTATTARRASTPSTIVAIVITSGHRSSRARTEARSRSTPLAICTSMAELEMAIAAGGSKPIRWSSGIASSARPKPTVACSVDDTATIAAAATTTGSGCPRSMDFGSVAVLSRGDSAAGPAPGGEVGG